jgi:hypothetical protein
MCGQPGRPITRCNPMMPRLGLPLRWPSAIMVRCCSRSALVLAVDTQTDCSSVCVAEGNNLMLGVGMGSSTGVVWVASASSESWTDIDPAESASALPDADADDGEEQSKVAVDVNPELFVGAVYDSNAKRFGTIGAVLLRYVNTQSNNMQH